MKRVFATVGFALLLAASACTRGNDSDRTAPQTDGAAFAKTEAIAAKETGDSTRYVFRKTHWGMTQKEVIAAEGIRPRVLEEKIMIYATIFQNRHTEITYYFDGGKLGMAEYSIFEPGMSIRDYLDIYNGLRLELIEKYGRPSLDDIDKKGYPRVAVGSSFVFQKSPTLQNRLANWELPELGTEVMLYLGYSVGRDDSTKSCDIQFKSTSFNINSLSE